jgi:pimeloyl-ACP methyl ester carboxylesterase
MPEIPLPTHHVQRMEDGRRVGYALYGDPDGFPVLNCHGGLLSRNDVAPAHDDAYRLGARVISIDRPGVALSDRQVGHAMVDWVATDAMTVLDALGVDRFSVMGWSLGGQYALAAASALPQRVVRVALLAGCPPLDDPIRRAELNRMDRRFATLSTTRPWAARLAFSALHAAARSAPALVTRQACAAMPKQEAAAVRAQGLPPAPRRRPHDRPDQTGRRALRTHRRLASHEGPVPRQSVEPPRSWSSWASSLS